MQILSTPHAGASYTYHVFTSSGTLTVTSGGTMSLLAVGGGGAGGAARGGGGGGAELDDADYITGLSVTTNQTITIGAGGTPVTSDAGNQGGTTTIGSLVTALGGGGGSGGAGGSGGGGQGNFGSSAGTASGTRTFAGGTGTRSDSGNGPYTAGGGGGGASEVGTNSTTTGGVTGGDGGEGVAIATIDANLTSTNFPITLTNQGTFCSGGAGGAWSIDGTGTKTQGIGGTGAGNGGLSSGNPATSLNVPTAATMYGAGGGAGAQGATNGEGLSGFAGIVIVRYITGTAVASGGQETITGLPIL